MKRALKNSCLVGLSLVVLLWVWLAHIYLFFLASSASGTRGLCSSVMGEEEREEKGPYYERREKETNTECMGCLLVAASKGSFTISNLHFVGAILC